MCLAVPMQLVERHGEHGIVANSGVTLRIALVLTPDAQIGSVTEENVLADILKTVAFPT